MRSIYLDEAGISRHSQEPILTVAGVIVHTDSQWQQLNEHFRALVKEFVPEDHREGFIFHTHEIVHGAGIFDSKRYARDRREVLHALRDTINKFQLPVVWGVAQRSEIESTLRLDHLSPANLAKATTEVAFMLAFSAAAYHTDVWMKEYAPNECANLVMENNNDLRRFARLTFKKMKSGELERLHASNTDGVFPPGTSLEHLTLTRIIDVPTFIEKEDAPPLQLADFCAYMIKRYRAGREDAKEYMATIFASMMYGPFRDAMRKLISKSKIVSGAQPL